MFEIKKEVLKDLSNVPVGTAFILTGEIGYGTEVAELTKLKEDFDTLSNLSLSDAIIIDVTKLEYWDSLALRSIFPQIVKVNKEISSKGMPLISFIGSTKTDVYDAAKERFSESGTSLIPWYESLKEYFEANN